LRADKVLNTLDVSTPKIFMKMGYCVMSIIKK
jgi:hypothetical protein